MGLERDINEALSAKIDNQSKGNNAISVYRERLRAGIEAKAAQLHDPSKFDAKRQSAYAFVDAAVDQRLGHIKKELSDYVIAQGGPKVSTFDIPDWLAGHVLAKQLGI